MTKLEYQLGIVIRENKRSSDGTFNRIDKDDLLLKDMQQFETEQIAKVHKCSQCGKYMPDSGEVGFCEDERAYSFSDYECMGEWNINHGLEPNGEICFDKEQWHKIDNKS